MWRVLLGRMATFRHQGAGPMWPWEHQTKDNNLHLLKTELIRLINRREQKTTTTRPPRGSLPSWWSHSNVSCVHKCCAFLCLNSGNAQPPLSPHHPVDGLSPQTAELRLRLPLHQEPGAAGLHLRWPTLYSGAEIQSLCCNVVEVWKLPGTCKKENKFK